MDRIPSCNDTTFDLAELHQSHTALWRDDPDDEQRTAIV
jgi:hypothetical protein